MKTKDTENMKLTADSGSTKCDWQLQMADGTVAFYHTEGLSPVHQSADDMRNILNSQLLPQLGELCDRVETVAFYGSGCTPQLSPVVEQVLRSVFVKSSRVEVASDMLGAARALCGADEGIACILGTGANSCLYDGSRIVRQTPALGYVLGDEGSGAVLGRLFLGAIYKDHRFADVRQKFEAEYGMTQADVINRVYRQPLANRWLASLSPFIHSQTDNPLVEDLVVGNFRAFFVRNIAPYERHDLAVNFVGSMAYYYKQQLSQAAELEGFALGRVLRGIF